MHGEDVTPRRGRGHSPGGWLRGSLAGPEIVLALLALLLALRTINLDHAEPSDFFPAMTPSSAVRIDSVVLYSLDWTTDVLYFKRPAGIDQGREVTLKIQPKGWEIPITVPFHVG